MPASPKTLRHAANVVRGLSMDAVQRANSGHPGMPMGMADVATVLWTEHMNHDPSAPQWANRDRFVLSAGHGSMLLYSLLHLTGYPEMTMEQLKNFRQWGSKTAGHPENFHADGIETTTGPLGQGISNACGMALAMHHAADRFNRADTTLVDHYVYVIASDGDLMEGVSHEACALAGHLGLDRLIVFYDDNNITIDGRTDLAYTESARQRFESYGWATLEVDGHDIAAIQAVIEEAKAVEGKPVLVACKTKIGFGSPNKEDTSKAHGEPLGEDEIVKTKDALGLPQEAFWVPDDVRSFFEDSTQRGRDRRRDWARTWETYQQNHVEAATAWQAAHACELPEGWDTDWPAFEAGKSMATRAASGKVLEAVKKNLPFLVGGSADLTPSNKTITSYDADIQPGDYDGAYVRYGVREHGMGAFMNGMVLYGGIRPYGGTFLIFSDYMKPTIRLAALMGLPVTYVFTHDSIGLGEDGPTHQPIEQLAGLRAIPNLLVLRPADATETADAWRVALEHWDRPAALALTRQNLPTLDRTEYAPSAVSKGAYTLADTEGTPDVLLLATGSEVEIALGAREKLAAENIAARVVSMPSWELFAEQDEAYRNEVLPPEVTARVGVEAASSLGWHRWVGLQGELVTLDHFGASAPYETIYQEFGLTPDHVAAAAKRALEKTRATV